MSAHVRSRASTASPSIGQRQVLHLAWPFMISMLSQTAMSLADTLFVARLGTAPLAGIGLGSVASYVLLAAGFGLTGGVRVLVSQATGGQRHDQVRVLAWQALWITAALGLLGLLLAPLSGVVVSLFGASGEVAQQGEAYLRIRVAGSAPAVAMLALAAWFQGRGDTRTPMVANVLANLLNIALDPPFIFGSGPLPALGVAGAAATTVLAQAVGTLLLAAAAWPQLRRTSARPRWDLLRRTLQVGAPMALRGVLSVAGFAVFVALLARAGDAHLGAHVVVMRIVSVSFLPGHAIGEASGVLVGQALGAGQPALARQAFWAGTRLASLVMGGMALLFVAVPRPLVEVFEPSAEVAGLAVQLMLIGAAFQVFDAVAMVAQGVLNGAGDTRFTLLAGVGSMWLVNLPLGWLLGLHLGMGAPGAWIALTAEILAFAGVALWRIRGAAWLDRGMAQVAEDERLAAALS